MKLDSDIEQIHALSCEILRNLRIDRAILLRGLLKVERVRSRKLEQTRAAVDDLVHVHRQLQDQSDALRIPTTRSRLVRGSARASEPSAETQPCALKPFTLVSRIVIFA